MRNRDAHRPSFKMLPLPSYVPIMVDGLDGEEPEGHRWAIEKPVVGRDGWYYNRHARKVWYEYKGVAYVADRVDDFIYHIETVCCEVTFTDRDAAAVDFLRKRGLLKSSDTVCVSLYRYRECQYLKNIYRHARGRTRQILSE